MKRALLALTIMQLGCSEIMSNPEDPESDFILPCSIWDPSITMCEDNIETDPITGRLKFWRFINDPFYGTNFFICGADLALNTGRPVEDAVVQMQTENNMLCVDAEKHNLEWSWEDGSIMSVTWENIYIELDMLECLYDEKICMTKAYGHISVE